MKKLIFIFAIIVLVAVIAGCNARRQDAEFETGDTTVVTEVGDVLDSAAVADAIGDLKVTSIENGRLQTNLGYHVVRGTAPANAASLEVNAYALQQYKPGETAWRYIASTGIGTLKEGNNIYTIRALGADGQEIARDTFEISYVPVNPPALTGVGAPLNASLFAGFAGSALWFFGRRFRVGKIF